MLHIVNQITNNIVIYSSKPFTFGAQVVKPQESEEKGDNKEKDEEEGEPPKAEFKPVTEEGAIYEQRYCTKSLIVNTKNTILHN